MAVVELVIQIGDSHTSIYKKGAGLILKEASVVAFGRSRNKMILHAVGNEAKEMQGKTDSNVWVESPVKYGSIVNMELAQLMLSSFLDTVLVKRKMFTKINVVMLTSCTLSPEDKRDYEKLAFNCDINYVYFVPSIIACAVGGGFDLSDIRGKMIVNIGAGSTEIAVVSQYSIVNGVNIELGGSVIDSAIVKTVFEVFNIVISENTAEKIKKEIGSLHENDISNVDFSGIDALTRVSRENTLFAKDLYEVFEVAYNKIAEAIDIVINQLSPDLANDVATNGIYFCGGGSLITGLEGYFKKHLNMPIELSTDPEIVSVLGGGILMSDKLMLKVVVDKN